MIPTHIELGCASKAAEHGQAWACKQIGCGYNVSVDIRLLLTVV